MPSLTYKQKSSYSAAFKSNTQRFKELAIDTSAPPGPVQSSFKSGKPKQFHKSHLKKILNDLLPPQNTTPSIPTKFQGYGYEVSANGKLELQDPVNPGYSGTKNDTVGPLDYDPNVGVKYRNIPKTNFAKVFAFCINAVFVMLLCVFTGLTTRCIGQNQIEEL